MKNSLDREEQEYFKEILSKDKFDKQFLFGQFLRRKGLITEQDIFNARMIQKQHNRLIGQMAHEKGWLTSEDVARILVYQEENHNRFGEISVDHSFLSGSQVQCLLIEMEESYVFFGEALVSLGVLNEQEMLKNLEIFNRLKIQGEAEA